MGVRRTLTGGDPFTYQFKASKEGYNKFETFIGTKYFFCELNLSVLSWGLKISSVTANRAHV